LIIIIWSILTKKTVISIEPNLYSDENWDAFNNGYGLLTAPVDDLENILNVLSYLITTFEKQNFSKDV